jgi:hypothetical protein
MILRPSSARSRSIGDAGCRYHIEDLIEVTDAGYRLIVGFIVTNMARPAERVVMFYNHRGTAEQWIKEGKNAVTWTRLSCHAFEANAVRLQLHALAYNLANFLRTLALPPEVAQWSMTTLRERLVKIRAKIVRHGRLISFQMAEVMVPRQLFQRILTAIAALRPSPSVFC